MGQSFCVASEASRTCRLDETASVDVTVTRQNNIRMFISLLFSNVTAASALHHHYAHFPFPPHRTYTLYVSFSIPVKKETEALRS